MLACDRQADTQAINERNNRLERIQRVMKLCSPVTDRQTHTHTHRQSMEGATDFREYRESWSCACL